jgi:hypothetical protein
VEACNNGYDAAPSWEDITQSVADGTVYAFENMENTAPNRGINVRVTVERGTVGAATPVYVESLLVNWE